MCRKLTDDETRLKDLAYAAYLATLEPRPVQEILDKLQDAYWQGLDMLDLDEQMNGPHTEPPF